MPLYGTTYNCNLDRPVYDKCILFKINSKDLFVIQQRFDMDSKSTYFGEIRP